MMLIVDVSHNITYDNLITLARKTTSGLVFVPKLHGKLPVGREIHAIAILLHSQKMHKNGLILEIKHEGFI